MTTIQTLMFILLILLVGIGIPVLIILAVKKHLNQKKYYKQRELDLLEEQNALLRKQFEKKRTD